MTKKYKKCKRLLKVSHNKFRDLTKTFNQIYEEPTTHKRKLVTMKALINSANDLD